MKSYALCFTFVYNIFLTRATSYKVSVPVNPSHPIAIGSNEIAEKYSAVYIAKQFVV